MTKKVQRKRDTVSLADEISEYLGSIPVSTMNLLDCWQRAAAPHLLEHTDNVVYENRPTKKGGDKQEDAAQKNIVLVYVDSPAYAAELSMDKELYRLKLQQETKKEITDIKFLVSRKTALRKSR
ncbi:MAG: DciA family protein [Coriobacteriales bacterium]|jgi:hypothetical protein|nr:DciA family protein [Coriobacteriales bacterium]